VRHQHALSKVQRHGCGMVEICGFNSEHFISKAPSSACILADSSGDADSKVTGNGCISINMQSLHDDICSDDSEEEDEGDMMTVTHVWADGHLKSNCSVPHHGWRSGQILAFCAGHGQ